MIQVDNLTKWFGSQVAVDDVSFTVPKGQIVGFLGPNGAGKTTTMRILTSFLPPTSGRATVAGHDVLRDSIAVRRHLGYLPEQVPLYNEMRVSEYLDFRAKLRGMGRAQRQSRAGFVLDRCGLDEVRRKLCGRLSKGFRQRVGLAEAIIHDPPILILDEPTVGLDPIQIREVRGLIRELGESHTILLSTHILPEVEMICDRVLIVHRGRIALDADQAGLDSDPVIVVEARGPEEAVAGALRSVDGVRRVTCTGGGGGFVSFDVRTAGREDCREAISRCLVESGWPLRRLDRQRRTLEDHFMTVTSGEEATP